MHAVSNAFDGWNQFWSDKEEENIAEEIFEHHLADYIVVPSQFVKRTLVENGVDEKKILINRYGTDTGSFFPADHFPEINPLVFIFVGSISIRKGVPLLLEAWKEISPMNAELWLVGSGTLPENERDALPSSVKVLGKISRVELPTILRKSHIFVLPSYFEGLAISQLEAAACGLPIIATTSSGATDIVEEGITGYVIEPGDKEKLKNRILYMIQNPTEVLNMHIIAKEKYKSWDWSYYCERWISILDSF
jgi:glycosyltransferase involved in cell wall biosynthesis